MSLEHSLIQYTKINPKCFKDINVRHNTTKLLEKRIEKNLYDLGENKNILDMTSKAQFETQKNFHWNSSKLRLLLFKRHH